MATATHHALTDDQLQLIARALADPRRYEILKKVNACAEMSMPCSLIREWCPLSPATLSHHMKELETAGLVRSEKDGKFVRYYPQPDVLRAYLNHLQTDLICL